MDYVIKRKTVDQIVKELGDALEASAACEDEMSFAFEYGRFIGLGRALESIGFQHRVDEDGLTVFAL